MSQFNHSIISSSRPDTAARCAVSHRGPFCARSSEKQIACSGRTDCQQVRILRPIMENRLRDRERRTIISGRIIGTVSAGIGVCFGLLSILRVVVNVMLTPTCALKAKKKRGGLSLKTTGYAFVYRKEVLQ